MSETPEVSVIITVYNGERYLKSAIDSVLQQTASNFELIVVDDGSDDRTPEILAEAKADHRVKVISKPRMGRARALNVGWRQAVGEFIAILDADDLAAPDRLEKQVTFLRQNPEVGALATACTLLDIDTGKARISYEPLTDGEVQKMLVRRNPVEHSTVMMPRHVLERVNGYNEGYKVFIDYELWVRIAEQYPIVILPDVLATRRTHLHEYFQYRIGNGEKLKTYFSIRWRAWQKFSLSLLDLRFVFVEPILWWLYLWLGLARMLSGRAIASKFKLR